MDVVKFDHFVGQYRLLEKDFTMMSEYVTVERENFAAYSPRFIQLFLSTCAEIDCVMKVLAGTDQMGIINNLEKVSETYPNLRNARVTSKKRFGGMNTVPFTKFEPNSTSWWSVHNKIKHDRFTKLGEKYAYQKANLKNCLDSLAAFYLLLRITAERCGYELESEVFKEKIVM